jgi:hypothetical protein
MKVLIKKGISQEEVDKELAKLEKKGKKSSLKKYAGKVNFGMDGLSYQKKLRNESEVREAVEEMKLIRSGKKAAKDAEQFINELENR